MKRLVLVVPLAFVAAAAPLALALPADAGPQQDTAHFKILQQALPSGELAGFTRQEPSGSTQKKMGMVLSEVSVSYLKVSSQEGNISIIAKVADTGGPGIGATPQTDQKSEDERRHTRTVTVKKYIGSEEIATGSSNSCKLTFPVANRYMIELHGNGTTDVKLLYALVDRMALDTLEGSVAAK